MPLFLFFRVDDRNISPPRVVQLKREIATDARGYWGESVLQDAAAKPAWAREQQQNRR